MLRITVKRYRCNSCGECEAILPGVMGTGEGGLLINPDNSIVDHRAILKAINGCRLGAIRIRVVE